MYDGPRVLFSFFMFSVFIIDDEESGKKDLLGYEGRRKTAYK